MRKITWLVLTCIVAVLLSLWMIANPGIVTFFIGNTLIKLPLWLFVVLIIAFVCVLGLLYHLLKALLLGPRKWWHRWYVRKRQKLVKQLLELQKSCLIKDYNYLAKHDRLAQHSMPVIDDGLMMLRWQGLFLQQKYQELQSILNSAGKNHKKTFIWRYYQAMIFYQVGAYDDALPLLEILIQETPNSVEIANALIHSQIAERRCIDAKNTLVKSQRILSQNDIGEHFLRLFKSVVSLRDLNEIWQSVPRLYKLPQTVECIYFRRLFGFLPQPEFKERMQKRLLISLDEPLVRVYLELLNDSNPAYEFIKSCWLKQHVHEDQVLNILVMSCALLNQDIAFIENNIQTVYETKLKVMDQLKLLLIKEKLLVQQAMPNQANNYRIKLEKLLLECT